MKVKVRSIYKFFIHSLSRHQNKQQLTTYRRGQFSSIYIATSRKKQQNSIVRGSMTIT